MNQILDIAPEDIEKESFRIISEELGPTKFSPEEFALVQRAIHATGDFSFAENLRFSANAIAAGLEAIRTGKNILVDVNMAASGISKQILEKFGGTVICRIKEDATINMAKEKHTTRSDAAISRAQEDNIGIVAIGNAPTALLKTMEMIEDNIFHPDLVIGAPVGFVNAAESKSILAEKDYNHIVALGRKGGTPVAVALVNALLRLA